MDSLQPLGRSKRKADVFFENSPTAHDPLSMLHVSGSGSDALDMNRPSKRHRGDSSRNVRIQDTLDPRLRFPHNGGATSGVGGHFLDQPRQRSEIQIFPGSVQTGTPPSAHTFVRPSPAPTVLLQQNSQTKAAQYSYNGDVPVTAGTRLVYDPTSNSFSSGPLTSCFV